MYLRNIATLTTSGFATMGLVGMLVVAPAAAQMSDHIGVRHHGFGGDARRCTGGRPDERPPR
jgi:hypothetical protein